MLATAVYAAGISAATTSIAVSILQLAQAPPLQAVVIPFLEGDILEEGELDAVEELPPKRYETLPPPPPSTRKSVVRRPSRCG